MFYCIHSKLLVLRKINFLNLLFKTDLWFQRRRFSPPHISAIIGQGTHPLSQHIWHLIFWHSAVCQSECLVTVKESNKNINLNKNWLQLQSIFNFHPFATASKLNKRRKLCSKIHFSQDSFRYCTALAASHCKYGIKKWEMDTSNASPTTTSKVWFWK